MRVTSTVTPSDSCIVGTVLDEFCHHRLVVVPVVIVVGVWDVDGVILAAFRVVGDEADWCFVDFVVGVRGFVFVIDGAFDLRERCGSNGKLRGKTNGGDGVVVGCNIGDGGDRG